MQVQARERMSESPSGYLPMPSTCVQLVEMVCNFPVVTTDSSDSCNVVHKHSLSESLRLNNRGVIRVICACMPA